MSISTRSKSTGTILKKSLNSLKVPKKAINESALELIDVDSDDFMEEIDAHLQNSYRFRKLANVAVKAGSAWLVHNRNLEEAFGKARKRLQYSDGLGQSKTIGVTTQHGFLFSKKWSVIESIASNGLKVGNVQDTWLGKPQSGVVISQCADIGLAYLADTRSKKAESYYEQLASKTDSKCDSVIGSTYFVVLVRWLKSKVYVTHVTSPPSHSTSYLVSRLDPQPGYTCHMTKWGRMDPIDPSKTTLDEVFHNSQVYLYEYNEEMDLKTTLEHVLPVAVVKCQWDLSSEKISLFRSLNDGTILFPQQQNDNTASRKALLNTPPSATKILTEKRSSKSDPKSWTKGKHIDALFTSPVSATTERKRGDTLLKPVVAIENSATSDPQQSASNVSSVVPPSSSALSKTLLHDVNPVYSHNLTNPADVSGRALQAALNRSYMLPNASSKDGLSYYVVNTCYLVWPVSQRLERVNGEGRKIESWQFPVKIISLRNLSSQVYEGLLQPRFTISNLIAFSQLHHELAGVEELPGRSPELSLLDINDSAPNLEANVLDPRRVKGRLTLSPCPPFVFIDRLREWIVPGKENVENDALAKPGRFAGYKGNYFLIRLPKSSTQRAEVAKLYETLKCRQVACFIKMPSSKNAIFCIFPDSDFSRSLGIPPLDSPEPISFHGILLLPHSIDSSPFEKYLCRTNLTSVTDVPHLQSPAVLDSKWVFDLPSFVDALPNGGKDLLQAALDRASSSKGNSETSTSVATDNSHIFSHTFTPMSPQEPTSYEDPALVIPIPDVQICANPIESAASPAASCDMDLESSFGSNVPSSPEKGKNKPSKKMDRRDVYSCDTIKVPIVPKKYSPYSLSIDFSARSSQLPDKAQVVERSVKSAPNHLAIKKVREAQSAFSDYNEWRRKRDKEREVQQIGSVSHSRSPKCEETQRETYCRSVNIEFNTVAPVANPQIPHLKSTPTKEELERGLIFGPANPNGNQIAPLCSPSQISPHEEEEGEILDDDEDEEEIEDESEASSEGSHSSDRSAKHQKIQDVDHRPLCTRSSPHRKRYKRGLSFHYQTIKSKKRDKHMEDVDYRMTQLKDARSVGVGRDSEYPNDFSAAGPQTNRLNDTDYRYPVYIPKSAETVSVPVKVINHAYMKENEALYIYDRFLPPNARTQPAQPSTPSIPRNHSKSWSRCGRTKSQMTY